MFFSEISVEIDSESFNLDEDSDLQLGNSYVCGECVGGNTNITMIYTELLVNTRNGSEISLGELILTDLVLHHSEYDNLRILCKNALEAAALEFEQNEGPELLEAEMKYDSWREEQ